jgi:hypothetical protein
MFIVSAITCLAMDWLSLHPPKQPVKPLQVAEHPHDQPQPPQ